MTTELVFCRFCQSAGCDGEIEAMATIPGVESCDCCGEPCNCLGCLSEQNAHLTTVGA